MAGIPSRRVSIRRIIGTIAVITATSVAVTWALQARAMQRRVDVMAVREMARMRVDLSTPGITEAPLTRENYFSHGEIALLQSADHQPIAQGTLSELRATLEIVRDDGSTQYRTGTA